MGQKIIPLLLVGSGYDACLLCPNLSLPPGENQFSRFPFVFAIDYLWFLLPPLPKKRHLSRGRKSLSSNKLVAWHISFGELGNLITCLAFLGARISMHSQVGAASKSAVALPRWKVENLRHISRLKNLLQCLFFSMKSRLKTATLCLDTCLIICQKKRKIVLNMDF